MFSNSDEFDFDVFRQGHHRYEESETEFVPAPIMEIVVTIVSVVGIAIVLALCCKCCCNNKNKGRVLQPPPESAAPPHPPGPGVYPQQQYNTVTVPTAAIPGHVNITAYPTSAAPYPGAGAGFPAGAPYPAGGAPYPAGGAPYPSGGAPYPAVAPYPTSSPYGAMPQPLQPISAPSAPEAQAFIGVAPPGWHPQAMPPSYDQVMSSETVKHPPYNPYAPH